MIESSTIDHIFEAARIVDVVQEFITLKRRGVNYIGNCPFHNERTPSFIVSPSKNIYKCFGCGKGGNAVNFIMEHESLGYVDALKYLARKYHIEVEEKEQTLQDLEQKNRRESLLIVSAYAGRIFAENLFQHKEGIAIGLSYFKERGFREEIIKKFELGYSLEERSAFTKRALTDGYQQEYLVETGLSIQGEHTAFDRFAGRVMFPIHSLAGKIIAFGGRVLKTGEKTAKYLNSPESDIYHKSKTLYGIFQAKKAIIQNDKCFLVEGYTDVLSLHQAGIENVVASSGTALTIEQIQLIKRFTPNITVLYDGDPAGIRASLKGINMILAEGMNVKVLLLSNNEDPDSFARTHSITELEQYISGNETDFISFKARILLDDAKNDPIKRAQLINDVIQSIALIPDTITRSVYIRECSKIFDVDENALLISSKQFLHKNAIEKQKASDRQTHSESNTHEDIVSGTEQKLIPTQQSRPPATSDLDLAERELIRLILNYGDQLLFEQVLDDGIAKSISVSEYIIRELRSDELILQNPLYQEILNQYEFILHSGQISNNNHFIRNENNEISQLTADLLFSKYTLSRIHSRNGTEIKTEENNLTEIVPISLIAYKHKKVMKQLKELTLTMQHAEPGQIEELSRQCMVLNKLKQELSQALGNRIITHC